jgi:hypothetical protein
MIRTTGLRVACVVLLAIASALFTGGTAFAGGHGGKHHDHPAAYRCTGGSIPSGSYSSITVAGQCGVDAHAVIRVIGSIRVLRGAVLDAQNAPATITVGHDVTGAPGSMVGLGCQPPEYTGNSGHPCVVEPDGHSTIVVRGNVKLFGAVGVFLNGIKVGGNVTVVGGGSDIPWSIKNNTIHGNLTMRGQTEEWIGILFNTIDKNVSLTGITLTGIDDSTGTGTNSLFVVRNTIGRNIACFRLTPGVFGYGNTIGRHALGQCASLAEA